MCVGRVCGPGWGGGRAGTEVSIQEAEMGGWGAGGVPCNSAGFAGEVGVINGHEGGKVGTCGSLGSS